MFGTNDKLYAQCAHEVHTYVLKTKKSRNVLIVQGSDLIYNDGTVTRTKIKFSVVTTNDAIDSTITNFHMAQILFNKA